LQSGEKSGESDAEDEERTSKKQQHSDNDECSLEKLGKLVSMLHHIDSLFHTSAVTGVLTWYVLVSVLY